MAWKELSVEEVAKNLGIDAEEVRAKQRIIQFIVKSRKEKKLTQAALAEQAGLSQARIAQIESGIGTAKITFDVLLRIVSLLGYNYEVVLKKSA